MKQYEIEQQGRVKFVFPQDMSSIWKAVGRGGMAKVKKLPCYCHTITSSELAMSHQKKKCFRGEQCKQDKCFHHDMITDEMMETWQAQKDKLITE